jgi:methylenetetrahydrofolate dehydrogenase (NADP+)/methenyltetrahydrofolate cyclohydrolase
MVEVLDGKKVAKAIKTQLARSVEELKTVDCFPTLAVVRVGEDKGSISYENAAIKTMNQVGIESQSHVFESSVSSDEVLEKIDELNEDPTIHGILVMQPLPEGLSRNELAKRIDPEKDVDGLTPENLGRLVEKDPNVLLPSTPKAVMELLRHYDIDLVGKDVCVVGSSPIVGKPLSILLLNARATVTNCHIDTADTKKYTKEADIVISATGVMELITADYVKDGAIVVDVGFGYKDGKPCGDVAYEEVSKKASAITPVPGGVGSITTAVLAAQVVKSAWAHYKRR